MTWRDSHDDGLDNDIDEREYPDDLDVRQSTEPELVACPDCGKFIHEEAERCHHCGSYVLRNPAKRRVPWWVLIGAVLALVAVLWLSL